MTTSTADPNTPAELAGLTEPPDDPIAGTSGLERMHAEDARQNVLGATRSPIDRALSKPNARPHSIARDSFDHHDPMTIPNQAWDPEQIETLEGFEALNAYGCSQAVEALKCLHKFATDAIAYREQLKLDPTLTGAAKALAVDDYFSKNYQTVTRRIDAAAATLAKAVAHEEAQLNQPLADTSKYANEVRSLFRTMEPGARLSAMAAAVAANDLTTLGAVLGGAPPYLSGLNAEQAASFRQQANLKRNPQGALKVALLRGAQERVERAGSLFIANMERITGVRHETVASLRGRRASAPA